ncbi:2-phosphosulfolactate phosphatase [Leucobacter sp. UCMA 4100]|uniref:2-phosphosulfolactate phosphatase n=1 Tax=Leucobacter sp. UCMA 4100 TaxID=2810534 RepID=UPI0022EA9CEC|nr:2-phosphosulfolactate phosphatase [Leucobacter sp. UCMA 4100]MDA3146704.1 2-phosphosulfolactate phosphatase [Leucobacter sp. UCMA 4100]
MTSHHAQTTYQVRLGWGQQGLDQLASSGIVVIVDAIGDPAQLAASAKALAHEPTVFLATLRNPTATARAIYDEQLARGGRTSINLVLAGDDGAFAVDDYLAAGALADALTALGIDHSAPDVAVAAEGFRPLTRAVKHLVSASASGLALAEAAGTAAVREAAALDAETAATRAV